MTVSLCIRHGSKRNDDTVRFRTWLVCRKQLNTSGVTLNADLEPQTHHETPERGDKHSSILSALQLSASINLHLSASSFYSVSEEKTTLTLMSPGVWDCNFLKIIQFVLFPLLTFQYISVSPFVSLQFSYSQDFITRTNIYEMLSCFCQTLGIGARGRGRVLLHLFWVNCFQSCACVNSFLSLRWAWGASAVSVHLWRTCGSSQTDLSNKSAFNKSL